MWFSPYLGIRSNVGGTPKRLVHNLLVQSFPRSSSRIEVFQRLFLILPPHTVTIQGMDSMF